MAKDSKPKGWGEEFMSAVLRDEDDDKQEPAGWQHEPVTWAARGMLDIGGDAAWA